MSLEIFDCEQGTPEWHACRIGVPTASEFKTVLRERGRTKGSESKQRRDYIRQVAAEILLGTYTPSWEGNAHTERGNVMEDDARADYALINEVKPYRVGFLRNGRAGASPDSLINGAGMLEIKTKLPKLIVECIEDDEIPSEHVAQLQGNLWIAEREWIDLFVYWPGLSFKKRVYRDEAFISKLATAVDEFNGEVDQCVDFLRSRLNGSAAGSPSLRAALEASAELASA